MRRLLLMCSVAVAALSAIVGVVREPGQAVPATAATGSASSTTAADTAILAGYKRAVADLQHAFWTDAPDPAHPGPPHIRPTRGESGPRNGLVDLSAWPTFWQMAQYAKFQIGDWRLTHSDEAKQRIESNWAFVKRTWTPEQLASDGVSDGTVNASDDAAWKANYFVQVHEVTGDPLALQYLEEMIPATLTRFADPNQPRMTLGRSPGGRTIAASPFGILYVTMNNTQGIKEFGVISTLYEVMLADAALYAYEQSKDSAYLVYAQKTYDWTRARLRTVKENDGDTATGVYLTELMLDPKDYRNGVPQAHARYFGKPVRGLAAEYSGGTLAMAVLAARLYRDTHDAEYLDEARSIAAAFVRPDAFLRTRGNERMFVNERDPWTEGYWYPDFVTDVLPLPGVDPDGRFRAALAATARAIIRQRTPQGLYGADWSGPELNINSKQTSWVAEAALAYDGQGGGQATPQQIMTSANSALVVQAAAMLGH